MANPGRCGCSFLTMSFNGSFSALVLTESEPEEGKRPKVVSEYTQLELSDLPDGPDDNVLVNVEWSSLNYKDGMVLNGLGRLVREYPHVPGVDMAGTVLESNDDRYSAGDRVALTGWRVGEIHWGGYAERARVNADWLVPLPESISTRQAMAIGTAGFTAMQALLALEAHGVSPSADNPILVTGASGGVGSSAIQWGAARGHHIVASTGRVENSDELRTLGAAEVIDRSELAENPTRPLLTERWAGCVDAVGGDTLAHVLAAMRYSGSVAACGLAGGNSLSTTVIPFLLRGVNLLGIDSVQCPYDTRMEVWSALADAIDGDKLESMTTEVALADVASLASDILAGQVKGRTVVRCQS